MQQKFVVNSTNLFLRELKTVRLFYSVRSELFIEQSKCRNGSGRSLLPIQKMQHIKTRIYEEKNEGYWMD